MALVRIMKNPVKPFDIDERMVNDGQTVKSALCEMYTDHFKEFSVPTMVTVNGKALMRADWDTTVLIEGDIVGVVTLPSEPITIFYAVVAVVTLSISVYSLYQAKKMMNGFDAPAGDPVYSLSGQKNDYRVMEPIEVNYGRSRVWCSYASKPFTRYIGNDQWLYQLLCIGQGEYEIHDVYVEDTLSTSYEDVQYEIVQPNQKVTLIDTNVETSPEVNNIELFAPNEVEDYAVVGPFTVVTAHNRATKIEVDLELPNGLYLTGNKGLKYREVTATFEYRAIDDLGNPVGDWQNLFTWYKKMTTTTPQRFTVSTTVPSGRYEVRGKRTDNKDTSYKAGHTLKWGQVRSTIPDSKRYGDVTLIAVKAKATNNLNNDSASRINVDCTRKLKTRLAGAWTSKVPTRSLCWAFYDVLVNKVYGAGLTDEYIDIAELERLDTILASEGRYFDATFKSKTTVWDALSTIAKAGRATPTISGTQITMVLDRPKTIPQGVFSPDNIVDGSFEWEISMWDPTESDSIEMTYVNPITYLQESVNCSTEETDGLNPTKVDLVGCTNRNVAYRDGMHMALQAKHQREGVRFKTGLEGILPSFGDLIAVQYPIPSFGQGSVIVAIEDNMIMAEDDLVWTTGQDHYVMIRDDDGTGSGPYKVSRGSQDNILVMEVDVPTLITAGYREPPIITFGGSTTFSRLCIVESITPEGGETVSIECRNYDPIVYSYDNATAPPIGIDEVVAIPSLPTVTGLTVTKVADLLDTITISWSPALGANSYVVEQSYDGESWTTVTNTTLNSWQLAVFRGPIWLRVAAIGKGKGPYVVWSGEVGDMMEPPEDVGSIRVIQPFVSMSFSLEWDNVQAAEYYRVDVYAGGVLARMVEVSSPNFTYSYEMAQMDGLVSRQYNVIVRAVNKYGESEPVLITVSNSLPAAPTDLTHSLVSASSTERIYKISWTHANPPPDLAGYKLFLSTSSTFTPSDATLRYTGKNLSFDYAQNLSGGQHNARYFRVAAYDVWGDQMALSDLGEIPKHTI